MRTARQVVALGTAVILLFGLGFLLLNLRGSSERAFTAPGDQTQTPEISFAWEFMLITAVFLLDGFCGFYSRNFQTVPARVESHPASCSSIRPPPGL